MTRPASPTRGACDETERWLLLGHEAPGVRARVERHLGHCRSCQTSQARVAQTRVHMQAASPPLDDVRRARMLARMTPALDEVAARLAGHESPGHPARGFFAGLTDAWAGRHKGPLVAAVALALGATVFVAVSGPVGDRPAPPSAESPVTITNTHGENVGAQEPPRLEPFRVTGPAATFAGRAFLGQRFDRLDVPAGTTLRARLGKQARITLIGPAHLEVIASQPDAIDVRLNHGQLVADYDHRLGGRLRVLSPDGVTEVIGTVFSVAVRGGRSRVGVSRGRVLVAGGAGTAQVLAAGQAWAIGPTAVEPLSPPARALLDEHERETASATAAAPAPTTAATATPEVGSHAVTPAPTPATPAADAASAAAAPPDLPARVLTPRSAEREPRAAPPAVDTSAASAVLPAPPSAEEQYRAAEADMSRRDWPAAEQRLTEIIAGAPADPVVDVARYELAQLALRKGDRARAQRLIEDLLRSDREPALREPAGFLNCEMKTEDGDAGDARACFTSFRQQHRSSAYDRSALGWLLRLTPDHEICTSARGLLDEYLQRYPAAPDASTVAARKGRCAP